MTGRPSAWEPNTACENRSCTRSCGASSYIAISSSTTSRSWSSSENCGANTMSVITASASSTCRSGTREYTTVCSREVAAFSSAPMASKVSAICCASYEREPLNRRCSMKCETPARSSFSSRDPAPIQKPRDTERTLGTFSEITRSPESSSERTYFCTGREYSVGDRLQPAPNSVSGDELEACPVPLGLVERGVGEPEERLRVTGVVGAGRDAVARAHRLELACHAPHDLARIVVVRLREQQRELVAA